MASLSLALFIPVPVMAVVGYAVVSDAAAPAARSSSSPRSLCKNVVINTENKQNGQKYCQDLLSRLFKFFDNLDLFHGYFPQDKSIT
jgi:hypothetical protein